MKLAIVGLGRMGQSLLKGVLEAGLLEANAIGVLEATPSLTEARARAFGVRPLEEGDLKSAERVLVAVKPQDFPALAPKIAHAGVGYISIMAGVPTGVIAELLGTRRVVRAMPNVAATIKRSTTVLTAYPEAEEAEDLAFARRLFSTVGNVYRLSEHLFDAFTAMSASAPAYLALIAEALADGGVKMGIPRDQALAFAAEVLAATGELLQKEHPAVLKDQVASPGGTTIFGLAALEARGVRAALIEAIEAATERGRTLGRRA